MNKNLFLLLVFVCLFFITPNYANASIAGQAALTPSWWYWSHYGHPYRYWYYHHYKHWYWYH